MSTLAVGSRRRKLLYAIAQHSLLICVGLSGGLDANNAFNEEVIVHGYARRSERAAQTSNLHSAIRFGTMMTAIGTGFIVAGVVGFFWFG